MTLSFKARLTLGHLAAVMLIWPARRWRPTGRGRRPGGRGRRLRRGTRHPWPTVVENHGGQLSVESAAGCGATFRVRFPVALW